MANISHSGKYAGSPVRHHHHPICFLHSYLIFFNDLAYLNQSDVIKSTSEGIVPYSFGTGLNLKINKGQLKLVLGLGATNDSSLTLNKARFHFGYTTLF